MIIAIIAANGRTGVACVARAMEAGHTVRAGVRGAHNFTPSEQLTVHECDATKADDVAALIAGADVVISVMGHIPGSPNMVQTDAMKVVVDCMRQQGLKRLISLTGTGVRQAGDRITLMDRLLNASISIIDPPRVKDGIEHAKVLQASGIEYTILRVLKLTDGEKQEYTLSTSGPVLSFSSRKTVAHALVACAESADFSCSMPIVSRS